MELKKLLWNPLTGFAVILSAVGSLFGFIDPFWSILSATSSYWFPAVSVSAATILPELGYQTLGTRILVAGAVVYVALKIDNGIEKAREYRNE